jgi:RND family efflux transporter MFP subunit
MPIKSSRNATLRRSSLAASVAIAVVSGLGHFDAAAQTAVTASTPERRDLELVSTQPGSAEAFYEADLGANVTGYVSELAVDVGSRVRAGDVLARIAVPELLEARAAAAADVEAVRSEHERTETLVARNSVTQRALVEAKSRLDAAAARQAELEALIGYATIRAPFDGVVTFRTIDPGDMVYQASSPKGGDQPLLRVAKLDTIRVKTFVPERDSVWVDVGDPATIVFDALPGRAFEGEISRFSGALDPGTRTMLVEIDLPNDDGGIRPGLYGQTRIVLERRPNALALPVSSVRFDAGRPHVFLIGSEDTASLRPVEVGLRQAGWIEVTAGLSGNERVVRDATGVTDGGALRVSPR